MANEFPEHRSDLPILYETISDLTSTLSISQVVQRLLERVSVHLDSEIASILLPDQNHQLRISHARGLPDDIVASTCLSPGDGISGRVYHEAEPLLIEDIESDPRFKRRNHERYFTSSAISVPLMIYGRVMGVLNVNNRRDRQPYSAHDLSLVEAMAGHAAVALFNAQRYEETLERAQRDALTGLANHGHFWSTLSVEVERSCRYRRDLALVMIDVDEFKAFNDRHGHRAGDEALASVAHVISERSRVNDLPARYGGEEFAVVLPETSLEGARVFAEKLRESIEALRIGPEGRRVTVSMGVAAYPIDGLAVDTLVQVADARLYEAKAAGRNRVAAPA